MSAQDNTEKILRSLHVMLSKAEAYPIEAGKVIVDKQKMLELLTELNKCVYDIMDEYELTTRSRDQAERQFQKHCDDIIRHANRKAEDIYAASVMYTDEALTHVQNIMKESQEQIKAIYDKLDNRLSEQVDIVRMNQSELQSQLQDFVDTDKYLKLIEDRNREIEKEKAKRTGQPVQKKQSIYADRQTEIKINTEYFEKMGIPLEEDSKEEEKEKEAEIRVNLDADYFRWKEENENTTRKDAVYDEDLELINLASEVNAVLAEEKIGKDINKKGI